MSSSINYRPDIDGLRAIAVLMVVIFHAGVNPFDGGYVGVDVFFVISGFLISSLILKDIEAGHFSMLNFWERRVRRILPALTTVVIATLLAGAVFFLPDDFAGLARQAVWQAFMLSNVYFYSHKGYFNTEHELEPLLHTWSLAVEEQFYLVFPVLLFLLWKFFRNRLLLCLWIVFGLSFTASAFLVYLKPDQAFFLLPYRAWELLIGTFLALHLSHGGKSLPRLLPEAGGVAGIMMILVSGVAYDSKMDFPGLAALLPCAGAGLIIWSGAFQSTFVSRTLSLRPVVFTGLVSYSWYLWHWPVFSFAEYVLQNGFGKPEKIACIILSFFFAVLSWKFVETPFRRPAGVLKDRKMTFGAAFAILACMIAAGFSIMIYKGFPDRFPEEALAYADGAKDRNPWAKGCEYKKYERIVRDDICQTNPGSDKAPGFVLWGDSQADAIAPVFITLSKKYNVNGYMAYKHDCPPILDARYRGNEHIKPYCVDYNRAHFDFIRRNKIKRVYLVATWSNWARNENLYFDNADWYAAYEGRYENIVMAGLQRTVDELQKMGAVVYFLIDGPTMDFEPPRMMALESVMSASQSSAYMPLKKYLKKRSQNIDNFVGQNEKSGLVIVDMRSMLCVEEKCMAGRNGRSLYFDHNHFSAYGANFLAPLFEPFFRDVAK